MAAGLSGFLQQQSPRAVPGISDTAAIIIGTLLTLSVIVAIVAANMRKRNGER